MKRARLKLLVAAIIAGIGWLLALAIVPRLGLGFEGYGVASAASLLVAHVVAGVLCCGSAIRSGRAMRQVSAERRFTGYAVFVSSVAFALFGLVLVGLMLFPH